MRFRKSILLLTLLFLYIGIPYLPYLPFPSLVSPNSIQLDFKGSASAYTPSVVTYSSGAVNGVGRKMFQADGLWWVFSASGSNVNCTTSSDGLTFATQVSVGTKIAGGIAKDYSIFYNSSSNMIYMAETATGSATQFWYRYGTLSASGCGSITWGIAETSQATTSGSAWYPTITAASSTTNLWVSVETADTHSFRHVELWHSGSTGWSKAKDINTSDSTHSWFGQPLILSTNQKIALMYGSDNLGVTNANETVSSNNGTTWSAPVTTATQVQFGLSSSVNIGDTVYFLYESQGAGTAVNFINSTLGGAFSTAKNLITFSGGGVKGTSLSVNGSALVATYNNASFMRMSISSNKGSTFSSSTITVASTAQTQDSNMQNLAGEFSYTGNTVGLTWSNGTSNKLRFSAVKLIYNLVLTLSPDVRTTVVDPLGTTSINSTNYFTLTYNSTTTQANSSSTTISVLNGTTVTISATSFQSSSTDEWCLQANTGVCSSVSFTVSNPSVTYFYYEIFKQIMNYQVKLGGSPTAPTLQYVTAPETAGSADAGNSTSLVLSNTTTTNVWGIHYSSWNATNPLSGSNSTQRWFANSPQGTIFGYTGSGNDSGPNNSFITLSQACSQNDICSSAEGAEKTYGNIVNASGLTYSEGSVTVTTKSTFTSWSARVNAILSASPGIKYWQLFIEPQTNGTGYCTGVYSGCTAKNYSDAYTIFYNDAVALGDTPLCFGGATIMVGSASQDNNNYNWAKNVYGNSSGLPNNGCKYGVAIHPYPCRLPNITVSTCAAGYTGSTPAGIPQIVAGETVGTVLSQYLDAYAKLTANKPQWYTEWGAGGGVSCPSGTAPCNTYVALMHQELQAIMLTKPYFFESAWYCNIGNTGSIYCGLYTAATSGAAQNNIIGNYTFWAHRIGAFINSSQTTTINYYHQFSHAVTYTVVAGTPELPVITFQKNGASQLSYVTTGVCSGCTSIWMDNAKPFSFSIQQVSSTERYAGTNGTTSGSTAILNTINHQYLLQISVIGSGSSSVPTSFKNASASISITATPGSNSKFVGFIGTGSGSFTGTTNPATVTMNGFITEELSFSGVCSSYSSTTNQATTSLGLAALLPALVIVSTIILILYLIITGKIEISLNVDLTSGIILMGIIIMVVVIVGVITFLVINGGQTTVSC